MTDTPNTPHGKTVHVADYLLLWAKHKYAVFAITVILAGGLLGMTFLMPQTFSATATLMPPEKDKSGGLMSFLSGSGALDLMKSQENPQLDLFKNVMDSRLMSEAIAEDPKVKKYFSRFDTSKKVIAFLARESLTSEPLRNGVMEVQVEVKTHWLSGGEEREEARQLAPHLSNLFVSELDRFNRERLMTTARHMRMFSENEYEKRMQQLDTAYLNLQDFQQTNKAVALPEQLGATVTSAAMLASQVQQLEMQIGAEERELSPNSAQVSMLRAQLEEARAQLKRYDEGGIGEYSIALNKVPALTRQLAKLTREVKMLETVSAYLRQQLEQERLNEQRNVPTFQILDSAVVPDRRSSPRRGMMLILGGIIGIVLSGCYIAWRNFSDNVKSHPEEHRRYLALKNSLGIRS